MEGKSNALTLVCEKAIYLGLGRSSQNRRYGLLLCVSMWWILTCTTLQSNLLLPSTLENPSTETAYSATILKMDWGTPGPRKSLQVSYEMVATECLLISVSCAQIPVYPVLVEFLLFAFQPDGPDLGAARYVRKWDVLWRGQSQESSWLGVPGVLPCTTSFPQLSYTHLC